MTDLKRQNTSIDALLRIDACLCRAALLLKNYREDWAKEMEDARQDVRYLRTKFKIKP